MIKISYYAIAVGRQQKITEDWLECRELTKGYSGAKFKKFDTYEEAERFIEEVTSVMETKMLHQFELEQRMIPSFTNTNSMVTTSRTEIYLASYSIKKSRDIYIEGLNSTLKSTLREFNSLGYLISSRYKFDLPLDETPILRSGDSSMNHYTKINVKETSLTYSKQREYLISLTEALNIISKEQITAVNIFTDSNYILHLLKNNIFDDTVIIGNKIVNEKEIKKMYEACYKFDYIFINYYGNNLMPNKLRYLKEKCQNININYN